MNSDSSNQLLNPKRLKTLAFNATNSKGNNLLHQFVLDNSTPNDSDNEKYINAVLRLMSDVSVDDAFNDEGYSAFHLTVLKYNHLMGKSFLSCFVNINANTRYRDGYGHTALNSRIIE